MEQAVEKLLVAVKEGVQLMWQGKDHMKIRSIDDFGPALIHPDFFQDSLAFGTVPVAAGIIVEFHVAAVTAAADITAEFPGLAV